MCSKLNVGKKAALAYRPPAPPPAALLSMSSVEVVRMIGNVNGFGSTFPPCRPSSSPGLLADRLYCHLFLPRRFVDASCTGNPATATGLPVSWSALSTEPGLIPPVCKRIVMERTVGTVWVRRARRRCRVGCSGCSRDAGCVVVVVFGCCWSPSGGRPGRQPPGNLESSVGDSLTAANQPHWTRLGAGARQKGGASRRSPPPGIWLGVQVPRQGPSSVPVHCPDSLHPISRE